MEQTRAHFFEIVAEDLFVVEDRMRSISDAVHPNLDEALNLLLSSGGKRIRPTLALLAGGMLATDRESTISLAAAIEMLHTATLVHDDLIDGAMLRRGIPTLNAKWPTGATVLTGDFLFARAARLAAETGSLALLKIFASKLMTMVNGEITQIFGPEGNDLRASYFDRIKAKTASLFEMATEGAAILKGSDEQTRRSLKAFGHELGIAFQIVDDIFDFVGEEQQIGKPVANDLRHGLITLPAIIHIEAQKDDIKALQLAQKQELGEVEFKELIEKIQASDAIDHALREATNFISTAQERLEKFPTGPNREALFELADYIIQRPA
jgi:geranylgeranyl pyrophosphate synthase